MDSRSCPVLFVIFIALLALACGSDSAPTGSSANGGDTDLDDDSEFSDDNEEAVEQEEYAYKAFFQVTQEHRPLRNIVSANGGFWEKAKRPDEPVYENDCGPLGKQPENAPGLDNGLVSVTGGLWDFALDYNEDSGLYHPTNLAGRDKIWGVQNTALKWVISEPGELGPVDLSVEIPSRIGLVSPDPNDGDAVFRPGEDFVISWEEADSGTIHIRLFDSQRSVGCWFSDARTEKVIPASVTATFTSGETVQLHVERFREAEELQGDILVRIKAADQVRMFLDFDAGMTAITPQYGQALRR